MDFTVLKDWWWLILAVIAAIAGFVKYTIKIHEAVEGLKRVAEHDKKLTLISEQYAEIKADTQGLKTSVIDLSESLKAHVVEQKEDIRAMTAALYSILDKLADMGGNGEIAAAHNELRKHTLNK